MAAKMSISILIPMIFTLLLSSHITSSSTLFETTTATTVVETTSSEENPTQCRHQRLNACQRYLRDSSRQLQEDDQSGWREEFPRCCEELERVEERCRCEAVTQVVERERQQGGLQGMEMREMVKTAMSLPSLCRIGRQQCRVPSFVAWV